MTDIYFSGVGMTRFGKFLDRSVKELVHSATGDALSERKKYPYER